MFASLMAARPLIKYGVIIGIPLLLLVSSHTWIYFKGKDKGKEVVRVEWDAAIAEQVKLSNKQLAEAHTMTQEVSAQHAESTRLYEQQIDALKRKVKQHARKNPQALSPELVSLYDDTRRVPNQASDGVPTTDVGSVESEVQREEVRPSSTQLIPVTDNEGNAIELTTEELTEAVFDVFEKFTLCRADYKGLSDWNDGREVIELKRLE